MSELENSIARLRKLIAHARGMEKHALRADLRALLQTSKLRAPEHE